MYRRLFVGTLLSHEQAEILNRVRDAIEPRLSDWWHCKLRWVKTEKLHTTWLFLGDCDEHAEKAVKDKLGSLCKQLHPTELHYDSLKLFPHRSHPVALVLLPDSIPEGVKQISDALRTELGSYCQKKEDRPFRPHLTLLRFPKDLKEKLIWNEELNLNAYLPMTQQFQKISLIQSHLGSTKDSYEVLADYPLSINC